MSACEHLFKNSSLTLRLEIKIKLLRESFLNFPREYEVKFIFFPTGKFCKVKLYEQVS